MAGAFGFITTDACFAPNLCFKVVFSACAFTAEAVTAIRAAIKSVEFFISNMKKASEKVARDILHSLENGRSDEEIIADFKAEYWHGYIKEIYPEDAVNLNTSIMIKLIRKELL